jgi:hypothetical protein
MKSSSRSCRVTNLSTPIRAALQKPKACDQPWQQQAPARHVTRRLRMRSERRAHSKLAKACSVPRVPYRYALTSEMTLVQVTIGMAHATAITIRPRRAFRMAGVIRPDTKQSLDTADNATDGSADDGAHGTGCIHADGTAMSNPVRNALCLCRHRYGECRRHNGRRQNVEFHATPLTVERTGSDAETRRRRGERMATRVTRPDRCRSGTPSCVGSVSPRLGSP